MTLDTAQQNVMNKLLIEAVANKDLARMKAYVAKGANINTAVDYTETIVMGGTYSSRGSMPLYHYMLEAAFTNEISNFFFEQGVSVDVKNFNGNTPLMLAVKNGNISRAKYFLANGADPLATNKSSDIVLDEARKLQSVYCSERQNIIDALVQAMESPVAPVKAKITAKPEDPVETERDIQTLKPIEFAARKKAGGFNL